MRNNFPVINVYKNKTARAGVITQLLHGDIFKKLSYSKKWLKIKNSTDNYKGYIKNKKFKSNEKNTHKISVLSANLYSRPNKKYIIKKRLSFGSKIRVLKKKNRFCKFENIWIKKNDIKKLNFENKNPFIGITKFRNIKYKWGGKHFKGVDCSGLIQLFLNFNNKFCPRDSKDQIRYFRKKVAIKDIRKNDLIFWKGHVAVIISKTHLIHAYGPLKKVVIMPIKSTVDKIFKTTNLKVIGIRRVL